MENRIICEEYARIGAELIENEPELAYIRDSDVSIVYLSSDLKKRDSKVTETLGQCEKIQSKYKWGIPCDFTITLSDEQLRILIFHELLHIGVDFDGKTFVRPHDLEDFKAIVDRYGTDWARTF